MKSRLTTRLVACTLLAGACISCENEDAVDALVKSHMTKNGIPGLSVAIVKEGKILKARGYGVANRETKAAVETETVFPIQSITKQFTAAAIMMLVEEGKIGLDDPISRHLTGTPPAWEKITLRHLLTHTSGIKDFINEPNLDLARDYTEEEILLSAAPRPLNFEPGDGWAYSNTNYHLLAMIIRKASGQWYGDFLADRVFKPLGMTRTWVARGDRDESAVARGYLLEQGQMRPGTILPPSIGGYGGGGIRSTVTDLARWDAALYGEQLLKRSTLEQMWTPVRLNNGRTHGYGFGWEITTVNGHRLVWHAGGWVGFSAQISRLVDDRLTVIVLTNFRNAAPGKLARSIAGVYLPAVGPVVYKPITDNEPQVTARFVDVLKRTAEGKLQPGDFATDSWTHVSPLLEQLRRDFSAFGPIEKLTLVERTTQDGNRSYRYLAKFQRTTLVFHFVLTDDNRISAMMPEPLD